LCFKEWDGRLWTGFKWLRITGSDKPCEEGSDISDYLKMWKISSVAEPGTFGFCRHLLLHGVSSKLVVVVVVAVVVAAVAVL
jgi:hypothetical protein